MDKVGHFCPGPGTVFRIINSVYIKSPPLLVLRAIVYVLSIIQATLGPGYGRRSRHKRGGPAGSIMRLQAPKNRALWPDGGHTYI